MKIRSRFGFKNHRVIVTIGCLSVAVAAVVLAVVSSQKLGTSDLMRFKKYSKLTESDFPDPVSRPFLSVPKQESIRVESSLQEGDQQRQLSPVELGPIAAQLEAQELISLQNQEDSIEKELKDQQLIEKANQRNLTPEETERLRWYLVRLSLIRAVMLKKKLDNDDFNRG